MNVRDNYFIRLSVLVFVSWGCGVASKITISQAGDVSVTNRFKDPAPLRLENIILKEKYLNEKGEYVQRAWADIVNGGSEPYKFTFRATLYLIGGEVKTDGFRLYPSGVIESDKGLHLNEYKIYPGEKKYIGMEFRLKGKEYGASVEFEVINLGKYEDPAFRSSKITPKSQRYVLHHKETYLSRNPSQILLYILVQKKLSDEELISICEEIDSQYKKIGWVTIFVYMDSEEGRKLAADELYEPPRPIFEQNWLAMYTREPKYGKSIEFRPWDLYNPRTKQLK